MAYYKSIRDKSTHGARQSKRKPPHGVAAPKGGFLRLPACQSLSLWERWHCEAMPERAGPARKSRCAAMGRLFVRAILSLCQSCLAASLPSQSHFVRQLPQRGSPWHVGQLSSGRAKHNISEAAVLRCLGQRQLDKVRLSRSRCPLQQGPPFCALSGLRRPA